MSSEKTQTIKDTCYKGTVIRLGNEKRDITALMTSHLTKRGFTEISIPAIQHFATFAGKVGEENNNMMFRFNDRKDRNLCLAPEYTAVVQQLAQTAFKYRKDLTLFYVQQCFRGERQQRGRWREFTQLGVEVIHPTWAYDLPVLAKELIAYSGLEQLETNIGVTRGLDYYKNNAGFEIRANDGLQLCGGGEYDGGIGFATGIDRLLVDSEIEQKT